jgi:hypothetical protein
MRKITADQKFGLIVLLLCLALWFFVIPAEVANPRDAIYPRFVTFWIAINSVLLITRGRKIFSPEISRQWESKQGIARVAIVASTFLVYTLIIDFFGFFMPTCAYLVILMLIFGVSDWRALAAVSVAVPLFLYFLVEKILNFPLPQGRIF